MEYTVRRASAPLGQPTADPDRPLWQAADELTVGHFPWEDSGHRPDVRARVLWDDAWLAVLFRVQDRWVRAVTTEWNGPVCTDSCVEFFVAPSADPERDAYFNFELNCGGTMLLYACPARAEGAQGVRARHVSAADGASIRIATTLPRTVEPEITEPVTWTAEYHVPWALFASYFGVAAPMAGTTWRANFYKCGDRTSHPHWGSWAPVNTPRPNFHRPECFQPVRFA
jgi:hypothetical protein